jgi:hypothetical protein
MSRGDELNEVEVIVNGHGKEDRHPCVLLGIVGKYLCPRGAVRLGATDYATRHLVFPSHF